MRRKCRRRGARPPRDNVPAVQERERRRWWHADRCGRGLRALVLARRLLWRRRAVPPGPGLPGAHGRGPGRARARDGRGRGGARNEVRRGLFEAPRATHLRDVRTGRGPRSPLRRGYLDPGRAPLRHGLGASDDERQLPRAPLLVAEAGRGRPLRLEARLPAGNLRRLFKRRRGRRVPERGLVGRQDAQDRVLYRHRPPRRLARALRVRALRRARHQVRARPGPPRAQVPAVPGIRPVARERPRRALRGHGARADVCF
mmetsp:Transcript_7980/g.23793  ORF Transcript_7980/g.23793 Transcript_7980/m.23793 type:complete len:258 (-) Transcript_7980:344-1117(-)